MDKFIIAFHRLHFFYLTFPGQMDGRRLFGSPLRQTDHVALRLQPKRLHFADLSVNFGNLLLQRNRLQLVGIALLAAGCLDQLVQFLVDLFEALGFGGDRLDRRR